MLLAVTQGPGEALARGAALGLAFHPVWAVAGALLGTLVVWVAGEGRIRWLAAGAVTTLLWAVGNAADLAETVGRGVAVEGAAPPVLEAGEFMMLLAVAWVAVGLVVGHAVPLLLGHAVGSRVVKGTGWLSGAAVAAGAAWALSLAASPAADLLMDLAL